MKFSWWMAPVIGVGACAIANGVLIATALRVRPQKVEAHPYAASAHEDARAAARSLFTDRGWTLGHAIDASACVLTLTCVGGSQPVAGMVHLYRPDDESADRHLPWNDLSAALFCPLPRPGAWSLCVELRDATGTILSHDVRVNRP